MPHEAMGARGARLPDAKGHIRLSMWLRRCQGGPSLLPEKLHRDVHGGLTFSNAFDEIGPDIWWVGFDTAHFGDVTEDHKPLWTEEMCVSETERLAEQVAKVAKSDA